MASDAKIILTALDQTSAAFGSVSRNLTALKTSSDAVAVGLRSLTGILSVGVLAGFARGVLSTTAALDDMAEATGASVEGLSRIQQVASKTGQDFGSVEGALVKLNRTLSPFNAESKAAALALKSIGLSIDEVRRLAPDHAFETIARSLNEFEDGAGKTQVALALLGKTGAEYLPLLKELAEDQETVAQVTAQQAAEAEKLEKAWANLTTTARNFAEGVARSVIPALNQLAAAMKAGGFGGGLAAGITSAFSDNLGQNIALAQQRLDKLQQDRRNNNIMQGGVIGGAVGIAESQIIRTIDALKSLQREQALALGEGAYGNEGRGVETPRKKQIDAIGIAAEAAEKKIKAAKKTTDDYVGEVIGASMRDLGRLFEERTDQLDKFGFAGSDSYIRFLKQNLEFEREAWRDLAKDREEDERDRARVAKQAADDTAREWKRQSDEINRSLTDALLRGFESGSDFAENFVDTVKNLFNTLVLRPIISAIVQPVAGTVMGALGGLGVPGYANASGSLGGAGNLLSTGASLASGSSGWLTGASFALADSLAYGGSAAGLIAADTAVFGAAGGASTAAALGATGTSAALGAISTIAPYVGIALAAAGALGLFGDNEGPAQRTSRYMASLGEDWPHAYQDNKWFSSSMHGEMYGFTSAQAARERSIISGLSLSPEQIAAVNQALGQVATKTYNFGTEFQPIPQQTFDQIAADRLNAIATALGKPLQEIAAELDGTAQALRDSKIDEALGTIHKQLADAMEAGRKQMLSWAQAARSVIGTRIDIAGGELSALDPQEKLSLAAKTFTDISRRAALGDLSAFEGLGSAATDYLGAARGYYASGSGYASVYEEVQGALERAQNLAVRQVNLSGGFNDLLSETAAGNAANEAGIEMMIAQLKQINARLAAIESGGELAASAPGGAGGGTNYPAWNPSSSPAAISTSVPWSLRVFRL